jgi:ABC-type uncharacterized transport system substrate-binding protein
MRRRAFIAGLAGSAAWPLAARAQQPTMPVIGYLSAVSPRPGARLLAVFRQSLAEGGFVEGQNVGIEYRWAEGQFDRLPAMAEELLRRRVALIVAIGGSAPAVAAKGATSTTPIVFSTPDDPVKLGLVNSLARPGGNATGVYFFIADMGAKQLGLLREIVPAGVRFGLLVNRHNASVEKITTNVTAAAVPLGVAIDVVRAGDSQEIEAAFATLVRNRADGLVVGSDAFFYNRRLQLATLATRHGIPAIYNAREYAEAGNLMTYGTSLTEAWQQVAVYASLVLKGAKPADLPVVQSTKFELVINLPTARALGITVPPTLLARADEVIE